MKLLLNDKFIGWLIAINAIITIGLCYDNLPFRQEIMYLDYLVTILFACEIAYKIFVYRKAFFKSGGNWFDASVVSISFIALLLYWAGVGTGVLENLVILRTFRLFKFFRIMRVIPNIDKIYSDFKKAIRVTSGILTGGFIILIVVGVILCSIFKDFDPVNFGDPIVSMYSVFRLFSVEGWYEIPDAMCEGTSYLNATFIRLLFVLIVLFGMFILGFIISSISDELAMDNNDEVLKKQKNLEDKIDKLNEKIDLLIKDK
jgi:voltage-gated sodium channel